MRLGRPGCAAVRCSSTRSKGVPVIMRIISANKYIRLDSLRSRPLTISAGVAPEGRVEGGCQCQVCLVMTRIPNHPTTRGIGNKRDMVRKANFLFRGN